MEKSFGGEDKFFRHPASKKELGGEEIDIEEVGIYYRGPTWSERTGSGVVGRINKYCQKYLNCRLLLEHKPGIFCMKFYKNVTNYF